MTLTVRMLCILCFLISSTNSYIHARAYTYPAEPGTPEWNSLNLEQRIESQQIPDHVLQTMTTEDIYESIMRLPSRIRLLEYPAIQESFDSMRKRFNVIVALLEREDAARVAFQAFIAYQINETNNTDFDYQFRIDMTSILLAQTDILGKFSNNEIRNIVSHALSILNKNESLPQSSYWEVPTLVLIGRSLVISHYKPFMEICDEHPELLTMLGDGVMFGIPGRFEMNDFKTVAQDFAAGE